VTDVHEEPVLVSACLLGRRCRHDGRDKHDPALERMLAASGRRVVPFCPEEHGGLGTPRPAAWITGGDAAAVMRGEARVVDEHDADVTAAFLAGARGAADRCAELGITRAYLMERSPSCGVRRTHVDGALTTGSGVTCAVLAAAGVRCEGVEPEQRPG